MNTRNPIRARVIAAQATRLHYLRAALLAGDWNPDGTREAARRRYLFLLRRSPGSTRFLNR